MICFLIAIDVKEAEILRQISEMYGANVMNDGMVRNGKAFKTYGFQNVYWEEPSGQRSVFIESLLKNVDEKSTRTNSFCCFCPKCFLSNCG